MKDTVHYNGQTFKKIMVRLENGKDITRCQNCYFNKDGNCTAPKICKNCEGDRKFGFYWENI